MARTLGTVEGKGPTARTVSERVPAGTTARRDDIPSLLEDWYARAAKREEAHLRAATIQRSAHYGIGIPLVMLTATAAALGHGAERGAIALVGTIASVLAALQTFLRVDAVEEKHRLTAARFAAVRLEIDVLKRALSPDPIELRWQVTRVEEHYKNARFDAPPVLLRGSWRASADPSIEPAPSIERTPRPPRVPRDLVELLEDEDAPRSVRGSR